MNAEVIQRFVKDQKIPISIYQEPYFSYFLELYGLMGKYRKLEDTIKACGSEAAFLDTYYKVRDRIIQNIKDTKAYELFNTCDMSKYNIPAITLPNARKNDVYKEDMSGRYFLSIDMRKANYRVLKLFDHELVLNSKTYEELVSKYTDLEYIKESKYTRQVVFGNMNPKRQVTMEKYYMFNVLEYLLYVSGYPFTEADIAVFTYDEIVIYRNGFESQEFCRQMEKDILANVGVDTKVTSFCCKQIIPGKDFYVKEAQDGSFEFKGIPSVYFPQVYKYYTSNGHPEYTETDLMFYYEGNLANFRHPVLQGEKDREKM